jgi:hypothetical protein
MKLFEIMTFFGHGNKNYITGEQITVTNTLRWYNTTYIVFAASILLLHLLRFRELTSKDLQQTNIQVVEMAIGLLEAMDESVVAKRAAELIKQSLSVVKNSPASEFTPTRAPTQSPDPCFVDPQLFSFMPQTLENEFDDSVGALVLIALSIKH